MFAFSSAYWRDTAAGRAGPGRGLGDAAGGFGATVAMVVYQSDAMRSSPILAARFAGAGASEPAAGLMMWRVKASNCDAISVLPASASGTPELSAVDTVL